jgi:hypothetical protein
MNGTIFTIAVVSCLGSSPCEFYYPAPEFPYTDYRRCIEDSKLFDWLLASSHWTQLTCIEAPQDWYGYPRKRQ